MTAELIKLRALPTPRWTVLGVAAALATALVVGIFRGTGGDDHVLTGLGADFPLLIAVLVLGSWLVGLEYGQGTMRRVLTAEPRRRHVVAAKYGVAVLVSTALTVAVYAVCLAAVPSIASAHDQVPDASLVLRMAVAGVITNAAAALFAAGFSFITRSMAGGVTLALVFVLIIDSAISAIPRVGQYTAGQASVDIYDNVIGQPDADHGLRAALVLAAWTLVITALGALRFTRTDA
ncbi:MAG: ABC transporter permease [Thermoleophilia bacterium]